MKTTISNVLHNGVPTVKVSFEATESEDKILLASIVSSEKIAPLIIEIQSISGSLVMVNEQIKPKVDALKFNYN